MVRKESADTQEYEPYKQKGMDVDVVVAVRLDDVNPGLDAMDDAKEKGSSGGTLQRRWWWKPVSCS